jgi:hypothetical protein
MSISVAFAPALLPCHDLKMSSRDVAPVGVVRAQPFFSTCLEKAVAAVEACWLRNPSTRLMSSPEGAVRETAAFWGFLLSVFFAILSHSFVPS